MQRLTYFLGCLLTSIGTAMAHPGHGNPATQDGLSHYVSSPLHAGPILAAVACLGLWMARKARRSRNR